MDGQIPSISNGSSRLIETECEIEPAIWGLFRSSVGKPAVLTVGWKSGDADLADTEMVTGCTWQEKGLRHRSRSAIKASIRSAASRRSWGRTCVYVFIVSAICEWPSTSITTLGDTP